MLLLRHGETTKANERTAAPALPGLSRPVEGTNQAWSAGSAGQILASNARKVAQKTESIANANRDDSSELARWPRSCPAADSALLDSDAPVTQVGNSLERFNGEIGLTEFQGF